MHVAVRTAIAGSALFALLAVSSATAQTYPTKSIRLIVPFAPGGANDVLGRLFAQRLNESLGQTIVVDNRGGGGGNIGTEAVAHAAPDGYTLLYTTNSLPIAPSLYSKLSYKVSELAPISLVANFPLVITLNQNVPAKNVKDLIALAKQRGGLSYGSTGAGSVNHLTGVLFNNLAGIENVHVPYKGAGPMMIALLGGEIEMGVANVFTAAPYVKSGRLRAVAVTSARPSSSLPGVPTMASIYPGFDTSLWHGFLTTAGAPPAVIAYLHKEVVKALNSPMVREALENGGGEPVGNTPGEFAAVIATDVGKYGKLVKISGAKAD
ncbi:MAG TPA: tripartite tricarboxylate transporter substrate binding protein [Burkholderiales bacterium]|nr:tripartite tricarboxylate transporter substrate binding protein [Burkholderiales bacterium]